MRRDLAVYRRLDSYQRLSYNSLGSLGRYPRYLLPSCRTFYGGSLSPAAHSRTPTTTASGVVVLSNNQHQHYQHHHHNHHHRRLPHHNHNNHKQNHCSHIDLFPYRGFSSPFLNNINITTICTNNNNNIGKLQQQTQTPTQTQAQHFSSISSPARRFFSRSAAHYRNNPVNPAIANTTKMASTPEWTGVKVRNTFFDYFKERGHTLGTIILFYNPSFFLFANHGLLRLRSTYFEPALPLPSFTKKILIFQLLSQCPHRRLSLIMTPPYSSPMLA